MVKAQTTFVKNGSPRKADFLECLMLKILQFSGALIDCCCGEPRSAPGTAEFSKYTKFLNTLYRRKMYPQCSREELQNIGQLN